MSRGFEGFRTRRGKDVVAEVIIGYRPELTKRNVLSPWDKKLWLSLLFNCGSTHEASSSLGQIG